MQVLPSSSANQWNFLDRVLALAQTTERVWQQKFWDTKFRAVPTRQRNMRLELAFSKLKFKALFERGMFSSSNGKRVAPTDIQLALGMRSERSW